MPVCKYNIICILCSCLCMINIITFFLDFFLRKCAPKLHQLDLIEANGRSSQSANSADRKYVIATPMSRDHTKLRHVRSEEDSCCDSLWKHKKAVFAPKMTLEDELRDQYS